MKYVEAPKYTLIQVAWAKLKPKDRMSMYNIKLAIQKEESLLGVSAWTSLAALAVDMFNYTNEMKCLANSGSERTGKQGGPSLVKERVSLAGAICTECPAARHCIIQLIHDSATNEAMLPDELKVNQYYW